MSNIAKTMKKTIAFTLAWIAPCLTAMAGTLTVTADPSITVIDGKKTVIIKKDESVTFNVTASNYGGTIDAWRWEFANGSPASSNSQNPGSVAFGDAALGKANRCWVGVTHTDENGIVCAVSTSPVSNVDVIVPKLSSDAVSIASKLSLWYFSGTTPGSDGGVNHCQKVVIHVLPKKGTYTWHVVDGSDKVTLTPASDSLSAEMISTKASAGPDDVKVVLKHNSREVGELKFTVLTPLAEAFISDLYTASNVIGVMGTYKSYENLYTMQALDQFGDDVGQGMYLNEAFGTNTDHVSNTWFGPAPISGDTVTSGQFQDRYEAGSGGIPPLWIPSVLWSTDPGGSNPVRTLEQFYYGGSYTSGIGSVFTSHSAVRFNRGYAEQVP